MSFSSSDGSWKHLFAHNIQMLWPLWILILIYFNLFFFFLMKKVKPHLPYLLWTPKFISPLNQLNHYLLKQLWKTCNANGSIKKLTNQYFLVKSLEQRMLFMDATKLSLLSCHYHHCCHYFFIITSIIITTIISLSIVVVMLFSVSGHLNTIFIFILSSITIILIVSNVVPILSFLLLFVSHLLMLELKYFI